MSVIHVIKRDHLGREQLRYEGRVLQRSSDSICLRAVFRHHDLDLGCVTFRRGDVFTEWFYSARWYNVFRIADGAGRALRGWYCNITRPARITARCVSADDLALDVFVAPDASLQLLDEDEFAALSLPPPERAAALNAVAQIRRAVSAAAPPFAELRPAPPDSHA